MKCTKCLKKELKKETLISHNMMCDECFDEVEKAETEKPKAKIDMSLLDY